MLRGFHPRTWAARAGDECRKSDTKWISRGIVMKTFRWGARLIEQSWAGRFLPMASSLAISRAAAGWAAADEPRDPAPFSRDLSATEGWGEQGTVVAAGAQSETEASLAARVAELERIVRSQGGISYASQEALPAAKALPECKPADTTPKPAP